MSGGSARGLSQAKSKTKNHRQTERNVAVNLGHHTLESDRHRQIVKEFEKRLKACVAAGSGH